jgi:hypothetical protein
VVFTTIHKFFPEVSPPSQPSPVKGRVL